MAACPTNQFFLFRGFQQVILARTPAVPSRFEIRPFDSAQDEGEKRRTQNVVRRTIKFVLFVPPKSANIKKPHCTEIYFDEMAKILPKESLSI